MYASMTPKSRFGYHIKAKFGITLEEYKALFEHAKYKCQICERPVNMGGEGLGRGNMSTGVVDHCHQTNQIRGVLCRVCNSFLGVINEESWRLTNYLDQ